MQKINNIRKFMFSGKAFFRIVNTKSKKEFIYKVYFVPENKRFNSDKELYFVSLLVDTYDTDNWQAYWNIGSVQREATTYLFRYSAKSKIEIDHIAIKLFSWFLDQVYSNCLPNWIAVYHIDRFGRRSRPLIKPEDIEIGYGKSCFKLLDK